MNANLTERFLAAFNKIDASMRKRTKCEIGKFEFGAVLKRFEESTYFKEGDFIQVVGRLRNVLIHEKTHPTAELATPAESVVTRMERIAQELEAPEKLETRFAKGDVVCLNPQQAMSDVLAIIIENQYSQFPVVDDGKIIGLLTENGITRWLAKAVSNESLIEFSEVKVATILAHEEVRDNMMILSRYSLLDDVRKIFHDRRMLEAVIVNQAGKNDQKPLGIITRSDVVA